MPAGVVLARLTEQVTLLHAAGAVPVGGLLGLLSIVLAARARQHVQRTLGRVGGEGVARVGRALGVLGLCVTVTAALALGFFGLLTLFAS